MSLPPIPICHAGSSAVDIFVLVVPLLFPLRGLLHGKTYTHMWVPFLATFYLVLGISEAIVNPTQRYLGLLQILFSLMLLFGASLYSRCRRARA